MTKEIAFPKTVPECNSTTRRPNLPGNLYMANNQAPVVQTKDNYIYRINLYPGDDAIGFLLIC